MKSYLPKTSEIKRRWYEVDASQFTLGRLATRIATLLRGKQKVIFTPHMDAGDFVVVKNASQVKLTGKKLQEKELISFSGYPGGIKRKLLGEVLRQNPEAVIRRAVRNMLPKNRLRKKFLKRLKVVAPGQPHHFEVHEKLP